jgi:hypothetical protein
MHRFKLVIHIELSLKVLREIRRYLRILDVVIK